MRRAEYELVLADAKDAKELWSKLQWDEEKQRGAVNTTVPEGGDEFNCQQLQAGWRLLGHNMESLCKELQFDPDNKDKARARTRKRTRVCVCVTLCPKSFHKAERNRPIVDTCANEAVPRWETRRLITSVYLLNFLHAVTPLFHFLIPWFLRDTSPQNLSSS